MGNYSYILLSNFLILAILSYFRLATHFNIIARPNERSSHKTIIWTGGGIIFYFGALSASLFFGLDYPYFLLGLTMITLISFLDDIKEVKLTVRLLVHFISMLFMFYDCGLFSLPWPLILLSLILSIGIINAYNFMDGINGITGGYSLIVLGSMLYINNFINEFTDNNLLLSVIIAVLIFNYFNFRKNAKCFAGDVGSVSIAFIIVFMLNRLIISTNDLSYIILLVVYGVDSVCTIIHRLMLKENIFKAHRKHLYQILSNELKVPHVVVSALYMAIQGGITIIYLLNAYYNKSTNISNYIFLLVIIIVLSILYVLFMKKYFNLHRISRSIIQSK